MKKVLLKILIIPALSLLAWSLLYTPAGAASASLTFSPSAGTRYTGNVFSVQVRVSTGGVAANSVRADVKFPTNRLEVTSVSAGGSVCTLFAVGPTYSNGVGTAEVQCGNPSGFNGSYLVYTISFRAKSTGSAAVSIANTSQVLAHDGLGTNILSTLGSATFTIADPPTAAPSVSSSTHPDQALWYQAKGVTFSWAGGYSGYSYDFNQTADTDPDNTSEGTGTSRTYDNVADGGWYFHIRGLGNSGWSGTTHFLVQVDSTQPAEFTPIADPAGESDVRPTISFQTVDKISGVDHYEINIDGGEFFRVDNPYKPDRISSGEHTFTVRAYDKAGNFIDGAVKVKIKEIPGPVITSPTGGYFKFLEKLVVKGTAVPGSVIAIYLNDKLIAQNVEVGLDENWDFEHTDTLLPGKYKLYAVVTSDGIESKPSNTVEFTVDATVVSLGPLTLPSWLLILFLLVLLALVTMGSFYVSGRLWLRLHTIRGSFRERIRGLREELTEDMTQLEHKVEDDIEGTLQDADSNKMRNMEHELEKAVELEIEETKDHLKRDLDQVEKDVDKIKKKGLDEEDKPKEDKP